MHSQARLLTVSLNGVGSGHLAQRDPYKEKAMSANGPPRIKLESIVVHDAKRRLRLVMELLEQEWHRQQTHGASKPDSHEEFHHENRRPLGPRLNEQPTTERDHCFAARCLDGLCSCP